MEATPWEKLQRLDGRWLAGLLILVYFGLMAVLPGLAHLPHDRVWNMTGVAALPEPFADLAVVMDGSIDYHELGPDWHIGTVSGHGYNYPHIWLYSNYLGLNPATMHKFGYGMGITFFAAALVALGRLTMKEGAVASLCLLSPPILLVVERGNIDLVMFILMAVAVCFYRSPLIAALLCMLAGTLKIYPAFGLLAPLSRPWKKSVGWVAMGAAFLLLYFLLHLTELREIANATPHKSRISYGACALFIGMFSISGPSDPHPVALGPKVMLEGLSLLALVVALAVWQRPRVDPTQLVHAESLREEFAFKLGVGLFLGTFALGTNYDYRLCMLLFCLPLLFRYLRAVGDLRKWASAALIILVVYLNWYRFSQETELREFLIKQALSWSLLACLTGILATLFLPARALASQRNSVSGKESAPGPGGDFASEGGVR